MARHETVYTVWNHVYEFQEQAWLFYRERSQNNGYFGGGGGIGGLLIGNGAGRKLQGCWSFYLEKKKTLKCGQTFDKS